ncbi:MAG: hypothetical protein HYY64_13945 [Candidatus Rokubacteria bacterium]|nr:hypothetical protein [Candidatus Rokubacteria bacterium]
MRTAWSPLLASAGLALAGAAPAGAHGFGQRYDLPVPLGLYLSGAAAAVAFSFLLLGLFLRGAPGVRAYPRVNLLRWPAVRLLAHPVVLISVKVVSVGLFLLFILAGLAGDQHPLRNLAPTLVWVIWWVGLSYVSALGGNLWALINPWRTVFGWAEALYRRARSGRELSLGLPYPEPLGVWPGLLLYLAFAWVELVFPGRAVPARLAGLAIGYSVITWAGMFLFGKERWIQRGEAFSLAFRLLARFAPTEIRVTRRAVCDACGLDCRDSDECINCVECFARANAADREWNLRPFAVGLLRAEAASASMMGFILLVLSTVTFDGFMATPAWAGLEDLLFRRLPGPGAVRLLAVQTVGLVAFPILFLGVYLLVIRLMVAVSRAPRSVAALAPTFAFTLVPIAIAYHLAHYLSFLVIQGQLIVPLASDPFGFGWNILGTAGYRINIAAVGARFAWYTAVVAIVAGHIVAVYLAHVLAFGTLRSRAPALRSQYPMTALMVGYTMVSLWILAQPIVESGTPSPSAGGTAGVVRIPADAVMPELGTGRLQPVGAGKTAKVKLTYRLLTSTFHDGTATTVADLLYAYAFAYRWGAREPADRPTYDPLVAESTALIHERLAGLRVVRVERTTRVLADLKMVQETPVVEVYLTSGGGPPDEADSIAPPWSTLPWHLIVLMEEVVIRGWAAFSKEEAARRGVEWLDLARDAGLRDRMASLVQEFGRKGYVPEPLKGLAMEDEGRQRWAALRAFAEKRGHFLVTNGPYILGKWSQDSVVLGVFRDLSYPLGVGSFDAYPIPRRAYVARVEVLDGRVEIAAEVEQLEKFMRTYALVRKPFQPGASTGARPDVVEGRYVVVSPAGQLVRTGTAKPGADGVFRVDLKGTLAPGRYVLLVTLYLNENAVNPDVRRIEYVVPPS